MEKYLEVERPRRIQVFLWTAGDDRLLTTERRSRLKGGSRDFYRCNDMAETLMHVLRDCAFAKYVREMFGEMNSDSFFYKLMIGVD